MTLWAVSHADLFKRYTLAHSLPFDVDTLKKYLKEVGTFHFTVSEQVPARNGSLRSWLQVPPGSCLRIVSPEQYMKNIAEFVRDP